MSPAKAPKAAPLASKKRKRLTAEESAKPHKKTTNSTEGEDEERLASPHPEEGNENDGQEEDEIRLEGFSSESDSSDEEFEDAPPLDVSKLPPARDDATVQKKLDKAKKKQVAEYFILRCPSIDAFF